MELFEPNRPPFKLKDKRLPSLPVYYSSVGRLERSPNHSCAEIMCSACPFSEDNNEAEMYICETRDDHWIVENYREIIDLFYQAYPRRSS